MEIPKLRHIQGCYLSLKMIALSLLSLSLLLCSSNCSDYSNYTYHVNSSSDLEQYLCNTTWSSQYLVFLLNSSVNFTISPGEFCQVGHQTSKIIIQSDSLTESATILCTSNDTVGIPPKPRRGLVFFNTSVTLDQLVFYNCGTYITTIQDTTITDYLNSSSLYYTSSHAAVLVFVHCQVNITEVNIYYSYGFAMIGINLYDSSINRVNASNSSLGSEVFSKTSQITGNGIIIHYLDMPSNSSDILLTVSFNLINLKYNIDFFKSGHSCIIDMYYHQHNSSYSADNTIINAAGLTVLYTQRTYRAFVFINNTKFLHNVAGFNTPGGLLILQYNSSVFTNTTVENTVFEGNINFKDPYCHGSALSFYWFGDRMVSPSSHSYPLYIQNTTFKKQVGFENYYFIEKTTGAVYFAFVILNKITVTIYNSTFYGNLVYDNGASVYAQVYNSFGGIVTILLKDIFASKNSQKKLNNILPISEAGIFSFYGINSVHITGISVFDKNYGSVIEAVDSDVYLSGNVTFSNNVGLRGAAIRLKGKSHLHFLNGVSVNFKDNRALLEGGAIYISENLIGKNITTFNNSIIVFSGNVATNAGNSIFIKSLFTLLDEEEKPCNILNYYKSHMTFYPNMTETGLLEISTTPNDLIIYRYYILQKTIPKLYPGETIQLYMAAVDAVNRSVYSTIGVYITSETSRNQDGKKLWLRHDNNIMYEGVESSPFEMTIHSKYETTLSAKILLFPLPSVPSIRSLIVHIEKCPLGFVLNKSEGICQCSPAFYNTQVKYQFECDINKKIITRTFKNLNVWAGLVKTENKSEAFGVSLICPLGYCNWDKSYFCSTSNKIMLTDSIDTKNCSDDSSPLCLYQRGGMLCGSCGKLSVVFGSTECKQCSNWWLLTLVLYAVAGPLIIYLLYALKLTLTSGTLNGIIFYMQASANCGGIDLLQLFTGNELAKIYQLTFFIISSLNIGLGFPICFYNGMTELWKTGLSLLFPLYLLTIVVVLIILSHYCVRVSNRIAHSSVQVLVTVIYLSFLKLLLALIDVFTSADIYTENTSYKVWYWDGSVEYGVGSHLILIIITLLVVIPLLLPYVLLLIFVRPIRHTRVNEYVRPLLEAIHAPYKEGKEYWFVARLFLLASMCIIYTYYRAVNYLQIYVVTTPIMTLFLLLQAYSKPFKNTLVSILDCSMMFNMIFMYMTTWFFLINHQGAIIEIMMFISVSITFLAFLLVLFYHVLWVKGKVPLIKAYFNLVYCKMKRPIVGRQQHSRSHALLYDSNDSFYGSCEIREPLLNSPS